MLGLFLLLASIQQARSTTITFPPDDHRGEVDAPISKRFDPLWEGCTESVLAHRNTKETVEVCKRAADTANEYAAHTRYDERRMSNVYAATAYANIGDFISALPYANRAVAVIEEGKITGSGAEAAYETRAQVKAFSGDLNGAEPDAQRADGFAHEMVRSGDSLLQLKKDLTFHAELLRRLGRPEDAQAKQAEADKL
jgi:hypothetical protein